MFTNIIERLDAICKGLEELEKAEKLSKPPVSEAQRRAMHAAAKGKSTLDIPKSVGKEFADSDKGGKLPEKAKKKELLDGQEELMKPKDKAAKAVDPVYLRGGKKEPDLGEYWKKPKVPESAAPTISYGGGSAVTRRPGAPESESGFKTPKAKLDSANTPEFKAKLAAQRKNKMVQKSEITGELLTKSMRLQKSDAEITEMLKSAMDEGHIHRNIFLEWQNFGTINPAILELVGEE